jgi:hypothetical protein
MVDYTIRSLNKNHFSMGRSLLVSPLEKQKLITLAKSRGYRARKGPIMDK